MLSLKSNFKYYIKIAVRLFYTPMYIHGHTAISINLKFKRSLHSKDFDVVFYDISLQDIQ